MTELIGDISGARSGLVHQRAEGREVFDGVVKKRDQRRQLVGGNPPTTLQHRNQTLPKLK